MVMSGCANLKALLEAERPALTAAFGHRRYLISKREHKSPQEIDWIAAKQEFMDQFFNAWAEGFRQAYCNYVCKDREACQLRELELNKWMKYVE